MERNNEVMSLDDFNPKLWLTSHDVPYVTVI